MSKNLQETIALHLEDENLAELDLENDPSVLVSFELDTVTNAKP